MIVGLVWNAGQVERFYFSGGLVTGVWQTRSSLDERRMVDTRSSGSEPGKAMLVPGWLVGR